MNYADNPERYFEVYRRLLERRLPWAMVKKKRLLRKLGVRTALIRQNLCCSLP